MCNKKNNNVGREGIMITDSLATLCTELATLFSSLSNITRTCLGIKEHLGNMELGQEEITPIKTVGFENKNKNWKENEKKDNGTKGKEVGNLV